MRVDVGIARQAMAISVMAVDSSRETERGGRHTQTHRHTDTQTHTQR